MRSKSSAKREVIVQTATSVFIEMGYEGASMAEIATRAGCSKVTLYSYFASKEDLFLGVISGKMERDIHPLLDYLEKHTTAEVMTVLEQFGLHYLSVALSPEAIALKRLAIMLMINPAVSESFSILGPQRFFAAVQAYLSNAMNTGQLAQHDPMVAAQHLIALYESETGGGGLFADSANFNHEYLECVVKRAVIVFLTMYGIR